MIKNKGNIPSLKNQIISIPHMHKYKHTRTHRHAHTKTPREKGHHLAEDSNLIL